MYIECDGIFFIFTQSILYLFIFYLVLSLSHLITSNVGYIPFSINIVATRSAILFCTTFNFYKNNNNK